MIGAGRENKDDAIDPAVGRDPGSKVGQKVDSGGVLWPLWHHTVRNPVGGNAAQLVDTCSRISSTRQKRRALILEVVG